MRWWRKISLIVIFCISMYCCCFADESGRIQLQVNVCDGFHESVMINLVGDTGENYLLVAEPEHDWKAVLDIPAGEYTVEYAAVDGIQRNYGLRYEKSLTVTGGAATEVKVAVTPGRSDEPSGREQQAPYRKSLRQIGKDNVLSLSLIGAGSLALGIIKYRKEKLDHGN